MRFVCPSITSSRVHKYFFSVALVLFYLVGILTAKGVIGMDLPILQLWFTPFVLIALCLLSVKGFRVPRSLIALCALLVFATFLSARIFISPRGHVLIARMTGDSADAETRIFREKLNRALAEMGSRNVEPLYAPIGDPGEAQRFLQDHEKVDMLIWGSKRWLNISFAPEPPFELSAGNASAGFLNFYGLKLASTVHWAGLSYQPETASLIFLSRLITGYVPLRQYAAALNQDSAEEQVNVLISAAKHRDLWSVRWHRGVAALRAANYKFAELLQLPSYDQERMAEVMELYGLGMALVNVRENAELFAALRNNTAIAAFLDSQLRAKKESRKKALKLLRSVLSIGRHRGTRAGYGSTWTLVNDNMTWIREYSKKRRHNNGIKGRRKKDGHRGNDTRATSSRPS